MITHTLIPRRKYTFGDLKPGQTFVYRDKIYVKTDMNTEAADYVDDNNPCKPNALSLSHLDVLEKVSMHPSIEVQPVELTIQAKEIDLPYEHPIVTEDTAKNT